MDATKLKANQVVIVGRVSVVDQRKESVLTLVTAPAADRYSHPTTYPVVSKRRIGGKDDEITQVCDLRSFGRRFTDKETGEVRTVYDVRLWAVE